MASLAARSSASVRPAAASRRTAVRVQARQAAWLPGANAPSWLNGSLAGDNGFDPLNFGVEPARLQWYAEAEKFNGRVAMLGVAGIIGAELHNQALGHPLKWYEHGAVEYWLPPAAQLPLFWAFSGFVELKRYNYWKTTGGKTSNFDPLKLTSEKTNVNEIKNGRLAMTAFAGIAMQALVSRTNPIEGLVKHLSDPIHYNAQYYLFSTPEVLAGTA